MSAYRYNSPEMTKLVNEEIERDGFCKIEALAAVKYDDRDKMQQIVSHAYNQSPEKGKNAVDFIKSQYESFGGKIEFEIHATWFGLGKEYALLNTVTPGPKHPDADAWQYFKDVLVEDGQSTTPGDSHHI